MNKNSEITDLPKFDDFNVTVSHLNLPISACELHGLLCGYICSGDISAGEQYLRALLIKHPDETRSVATMMYNLYAYSQYQISSFDFTFSLLLPDDYASLTLRAEAFANWCEGFTQGMTLSGVGAEQLKEEEAKEALSHITEFAQMDFAEIAAESQQDDRALMEVSEYTRMAVLGIFADLHTKKSGDSKVTH